MEVLKNTDVTKTATTDQPAGKPRADLTGHC